MTLVAFHNSRDIKAKYLARVRAHRVADELISGSYWEQDTNDGRWRGCAVGCTIHSGEHGAYEKELGIPEPLAQLEDSIFERLSKTDSRRAQKWPEKFLEAVQVGADLSDVTRRFLLWCLREQALPVVQSEPRCAQAVEDVIALYMCHDVDKRIATRITREAFGAAGTVFSEDHYSFDTAVAAMNEDKPMAAVRRVKEAGMIRASKATYAAGYAAQAVALTKGYWAGKAAQSAAYAAILPMPKSTDEWDQGWATAVKAQTDKLFELLRNAPMAVSV